MGIWEDGPTRGELTERIAELEKVSTVEGARQSKRHWQGLAREERRRRKDAEAKVARVETLAATLGHFAESSISVTNREIYAIARDGIREALTASDVEGNLPPWFNPATGCRANGRGHTWESTGPTSWKCLDCPTTLTAAESGDEHERSGPYG